MASSGHLSIAKRIPAFWHSHLEAALTRSSLYAGKTDGSARYVWTGIETPGIETSNGMWTDHIFNMATIALGAYDYCELSGDRDFLRDAAYPVMRGCAEFYRLRAVYRMGDGRVIIGYCTDLERLGAGRLNAFMTTCGAAATFNAAAASADMLGVDADLAGQWRRLAEELLAHLPHDGEKYLPYPDCKEKSIAVLAGLCPFRSLPADNSLMVKAVDDFLAAGSAGNMYPMGKSICTWYAGWIAIALIRLGRYVQAWRFIEDTANDTGCFSEIYEVHEKHLRPWFSTGEGCFTHAVNELLQAVAREAGDKNSTAEIPDALRDFRFKLPSRNGTVSQVQIRSGKPVKA